jgi:hypothetical protein
LIDRFARSDQSNQEEKTMSRAYQIKVSETLKRVLRAQDGVSTQLEMLVILPPQEMAQLLAAELERRGYERKDKVLQKELEGGIVVTIDPETGKVSVRAEACADVELEQQREGRAWQETDRKKAESALREEVQKDLRKKSDEEEAKLQKKLTDRLEAILGDLRQELDQAVNRVTAEALKTRAAQIGQIKEMTEDPQSGSLTIVVEV